MQTTETPTRPDLSSLDWETRVNLVFAEVLDGATWVVLNRLWFLFKSAAATARATEPLVVGKRYGPAPDSDKYLVYLHPDEPAVHLDRDYLNDPAAAWSLMERERITLNAPDDDAPPDTDWAAFAGDPLLLGMYAGRGWGYGAPGRAVAIAALHKHADGPFADLIRPLLQEVERA